MDYKEQYLYLLTDSIFSALIFNVNGELVVDVMRLFKTYNYIYVIITSTIGSIIGSMANIFLGRMFITVKKAELMIHNQQNYHIIEKFVNKLIYILLFLSSIHTIGAIIMTIFGILKKNLSYKYFFTILIGRLIYYSSKFIMY